MSGHVEVYYVMSSPWAYLGWLRLRDVLGATGASVTLRPVDVAAVFAASGGLPLAERPKQRRAYRLQELRRWATWLNVELNLEPQHLPVQGRLAERMATALRLSGGNAFDFSHACMRACWAQERDIGDPATLQEIANAQGLNGATLLAAAEGDEAARAFKADTEQAIARGVFGVPWFAVGDEDFWGQDRLEFVERALR